MTTSTADLRHDVETEDQFQHAINSLRSVLRAVENGETSVRAELRYSASDPMAALGTAVNMVIGHLARVREDTVAYQRDLEDQVVTIEKQRAAIRELSTPMIEVQAGVLCVPIVGIIDSVRASEMTMALLAAIVEKKVQFAVIDITGIEVMDTRAIDHFLRMARSVRLLGAECVLSGINPTISQSIVHMGVELTGIRSYRSLRDALQRYAKRNPRLLPRAGDFTDNGEDTGDGR